MADGFERTSDEREQARLERERNRDGDPSPRRPPPPPRRPPPRRPRAGRTPAARRRSAPPHRRHSWAGRILALLALAAAAAVIWFLVELFQPFHGSPHGQVTVTIPAHSKASQVGDELARAGVISSGFFFELRATLAGERSDLRAGTYRLQLGMTYSSVLKILTTPPPAAKVTNITIIEGRTRAQVNDLLRAEGVAGSYFAVSRRSPLIDFAAYGAPRHTPDLEGFLFPDTYQLVEPISVQKLVNDQLTTFRQQFATVNLRYARSKHLTPYDVLIIASMVQAEAATAHDAPLIASVIYNRLALGMPLQIDATTRYITGNYTKPLTQAELNSPSPYNTRIHKGLPPTPIGNPGLAAIQAAAHPAHTNYLYYVVKPCGNGEQVFSSNYNQFLHDVQQYQQARNARGGRSPERCS
ncbi:MAG TPA: endolytic transglycosylase MltG [Solirubrobacteraceae bacterium]|nr:endolytic transglycosylase MltG [Solirubrobacteraceae bacterium]